MNPNNLRIIGQAEQFAREFHQDDASGHDEWHILRVVRFARVLAKLEGADQYICELAAWLHDVADEKLNESKEAGCARVGEWLIAAGTDNRDIEHVLEIIRTMSFSSGTAKGMHTLEGQVVQDADRLDAIGAIGIARTFAYAGSRGREIYDPGIAVRERMSNHEYRSDKSTTINHFYEKLLKLKDLLNTQSARQLAIEKHRSMEDFLDRFDHEWSIGNEAYLAESLSYRGKVTRVHVAFDLSTAGSIEIMLRSKPDEIVISLPDDLSVGLLPDHDQYAASYELRRNWFTAHYSPSNQARLQSALVHSAVQWMLWPQQLLDLPCTIWAGGSALEQTGLRRLLSQIPSHSDMVIINPTAILHELYPTITYRGTFEIVPEQLAIAMERSSQERKLSPDEIAGYCTDWNRLRAENGVLRVLEQGVLRTVPESHYDAMIMESVYSVKARSGEFKRSSRVIGEVIGHHELGVSDGYIEYRVRELIKASVLTYTGDLSEMAKYSVSLTEAVDEESKRDEKQRLQAVRLQSLMQNMMDTHLTERDIMEELKGMGLTDDIWESYHNHHKQRVLLLDSLTRILGEQEHN